MADDSYILPNLGDLNNDSQGNPLEFKGRVKYNATYDDVGETTTQPTAPQLWQIAKTYLVVDPWFDALGVPIAAPKPTVSEDYEDAHVRFLNVKENGEIEELVYDPPLSGDALDDIREYIGLPPIPSLDFSDENNSQYTPLI